MNENCPVKDCKHDCNPFQNPCWHHQKMIEENANLKAKKCYKGCTERQEHIKRDKEIEQLKEALEQSQLFAKEWQKAFVFALMRCGGHLTVKIEDEMPRGKVKVEQKPNGDTVFILREVDASGIPIIGGSKRTVILS